MSIPTPPFEEGRLNRAPVFPVSGTANPVVQARIQVPVRTGSVDAYVKLLKPKAFAAESICAWLAIRVGLHVPTPFWVTAHRRLLQSVWPYGEKEAQVCFGSEAVPSAMAFRLDAQAADVLARHGLHLTMLGQIALFDELVGNDDRHDGNLLVTYDGSFFLIDHERAVGGTGLGLFSTDPPLGPNRLLDRLRKLSSSERMALAKPLREFCAHCERAVLSAPYDVLIEDPEIRLLVQSYLARRADKLRDTLEATLGIRDLSGLRDSSRQSSVL